MWSALGHPQPASEFVLARNRYVLREDVGDPSKWSYSWQIRDDVTLGSTCDFCGRSTQRLTYEVVRGEQVAWICPNCVGRYNLGAEIDGYRVGPRAARSYAHGLTARLKQQTCSEIIRRAQVALPDADLEAVVVYFDRNLQLSPLHAARLFAALVQIGEEANARIFEIQTRSNAHHQEFGDLPDDERRLVWIALSPQQRRRLASLGFAPESTLVPRSQSCLAPRVEVLLSTPRMPALPGAASLDLDPKQECEQ
jgi:hypothetical protein